MKHLRIAAAVILAGAVLSGGFFLLSAETPGADIEVVEIQEVPSIHPESERAAQAVTIESDTDAKPETAAEKEFEVQSKAPEESSEAETRIPEKSSAAITEAPGKTPETEAETERITEEDPVAETEITTEEVSEAESETSEENVPKEDETETEETSAAAQGLYEISCAASADFVLDVRHCTVRDTDDKTIQAFRPLDVNQQKFYLEALPDGCFRISVLHTGDALTALPESGSVAMAAMEHPEDSAASASQSWILEKAPRGCCYIRTQEGQYLTLGSARPYAGAPVILSAYDGGYSQMWKLDNTWISAKSCADTDLTDPYGKDGPYSSLRISFLFGANTETITAEDLSAHIAENEEHQFVLDTEYLDDFVAKLAAKYDTQGQPKRFRTSYGSEITLYEGNFGWKLDTEKTRALISEYLETNQVRYLAPVWSHKGQSLGSEDVIGDSYVEVDLENQRVFLYKDGKKLLETDCVSGTASDPERDTPGGVYSIYYKNSPDVLDGPGYSEFVNYWMPFYGGYGLHDATWRSEFGGDIYKNDGSHGCINLPLEAAELIYNTVTVGYPVVLYK